MFILICQRSSKVNYRKLSLEKKKKVQIGPYLIMSEKKKEKTFLVSLSSILFPENNLCSLTGSHKNRVSHSWIEDSGAALLVRLFSYFHTLLTTDGVRIWILAVLKWMFLRACADLRLYTWASADGNDNGVTQEMASVSDELRCATLTIVGCIA